MFDKNNKDIETLDTLIATTCDSIEGYRDSAEKVDDPQLAATFRECAQERTKVLESLQSQLVANGGEKRDEGSILGAMHRTYLGLKDAVTGSDRQAICNEIETGENYLKEKFDAALSQDELSPQTRQVIQTAQTEIARTGQPVSGIMPTAV
ncbi:ferritin-like domain-containing protein [Sphingomicrobium clamense]|uniref:PA2169 family four-helix-bundle protein n=1 Tax=Sphingomicrobium clamense TaxID=2851013 RepID=A0ABS6V5L1_9SPHN|nr:PA2169 family four-helix-bundle protein [Sphingomicrobium sp. B8]MBW0144635.1 PA2169 family four-helix-bundle protein [Sphingomicrobium sp. B8]